MGFSNFNQGWNLKNDAGTWEAMCGREVPAIWRALHRRSLPENGSLVWDRCEATGVGWRRNQVLVAPPSGDGSGQMARADQFLAIGSTSM